MSEQRDCQGCATRQIAEIGWALWLLFLLLVIWGGLVLYDYASSSGREAPTTAGVEHQSDLAIHEGAQQ